MGAVELLIGVIFVLALGVGITLTTSAISPPEFFWTRICYILAATALAAGYFLWISQAPRSAWMRVLLGSVVGISVFVGLPALLQWVNVRATTALALSQAASLPAGAGGTAGSARVEYGDGDAKGGKGGKGGVPGGGPGGKGGDATVIGGKGSALAGDGGDAGQNPGAGGQGGASAWPKMVAADPLLQRVDLAQRLINEYRMRFGATDPTSIDSEAWVNNQLRGLGQKWSVKNTSSGFSIIDGPKTDTPTAPVASRPQIGSDNTMVNVPIPQSMGDGNTFVGPTDSNGSAIYNKGGTAIGKNACADHSSIAIGANANAGVCQIPENK
jgi:hypothetical protein